MNKDEQLQADLQAARDCVRYCDAAVESQHERLKWMRKQRWGKSSIDRELVEVREHWVQKGRALARIDHLEAGRKLPTGTLDELRERKAANHQAWRDMVPKLHPKLRRGWFTSRLKPTAAEEVCIAAGRLQQERNYICQAIAAIKQRGKCERRVRKLPYWKRRFLDMLTGEQPNGWFDPGGAFPGLYPKDRDFPAVSLHIYKRRIIDGTFTAHVRFWMRKAREHRAEVWTGTDEVDMVRRIVVAERERLAQGGGK